LQQLKLLEPVLLPDGIAFFQHKLCDGRVFTNLREFAFGIYTLGREGVDEMQRVRDDDGHRLLGMLCCEDANIADKVAGFVNGLKPLKSNVLIKVCSTRSGLEQWIILTSPHSNLIRFFNLQGDKSTCPPLKHKDILPINE
jgi:hypothetical protein